VRPKKVPELLPSLFNKLEEIKEEEHMDSYVLQKSQDMTAMDSMAFRMKKKKRPSKHHKHRLFKQKSHHSSETMGEIGNLKNIMSSAEDPPEHLEAERERLMKKHCDEINDINRQKMIRPLAEAGQGVQSSMQLNHNSSMSTPLLHQINSYGGSSSPMSCFSSCSSSLQANSST
jgi:hypothetical protein